MLSGDRFAQHSRIVVELGMGDGRLLEILSNQDRQSLYVGIEIDQKQFDQADCRISADNTVLVCGSFDQLIQTLPDNCIDLFLAVLPDPAFIDPSRHDNWNQFYRQIYTKLKPGGTFQLITELTDELLRPVSEESYQTWTTWLRQTFVSLGFAVVNEEIGAPVEYRSRCLDQFRGDAEGIRMVTFDFRKP
jgi:tRNA G46 methylase TrmB